MDIFRMQCFVSVAKHLNLTKAAKEMFITQPSMSAQMNSLEDEMGIALLERSRRGLSLTPAGKLAAEHFKSILEQYKELETAILTMRDVSCAKISVGYHGPSEWAGLTEMLRAFHDANPNIELELVIDMWDSLRERVRNRDIDVAFIEDTELEKEPNIERRVILRDKICIVVPLGHPFADLDCVTPAQLSGENIILPDYNISPSFFRKAVRGFEKYGIHGSELGKGNYSEALNTLVASGYGITMLPASFCSSSSAVRSIPLDSDVRANIAVAWHKDSINPAARRFAEFAANYNWE